MSLLHKQIVYYYLGWKAILTNPGNRSGRIALFSAFPQSLKQPTFFISHSTITYVNLSLRLVESEAKKYEFLGWLLSCVASDAPINHWFHVKGLR